MHDAHFLCDKVSLRVAQTHSRHPPHTRSPHFTLSSFHALQELKDDLLDDTAWPVVMQLLNEDHWRSSKQIFIFGLIFEFNMAEARLELVGST